MKSKFLKVIAFILLSNIAFSQPNDTIYGKIKSLREQLIFLDNNQQNRKLFSSESDYGHNGFVSEKFTKNRFNNWWYQTYWVHYINYFKEFNKSNKLRKVVWYNKDQSILSSYKNKYDEDGKLVHQELKSYKSSKTTNQYDENKNLILSKTIDSDKNYSTTKMVYNQKNRMITEDYFNSLYPTEKRKLEYYYDNQGNVIELKQFDENGESHGSKFEYDIKSRKTKIIDHSPFISVKTSSGSSQKRDNNGSDRISQEFKYDEKDRVIETKFYISDLKDYFTSQLSRREVTIYENDLIKNTYFYDHKDSVTYYKTLEYDDLKRKIKEYSISPKSPDNNSTLEYFYNETDYPIKLLSIEKGITTQVDFAYVFDDKKKWIEQTKSVNGKKLYVWKRKLKYFE